MEMSRRKTHKKIFRIFRLFFLVLKKRGGWGKRKPPNKSFDSTQDRFGG